MSWEGDATKILQKTERLIGESGGYTGTKDTVFTFIPFLTQPVFFPEFTPCITNRNNNVEDRAKDILSSPHIAALSS